jgi:hypothetical protein
MDGAPLAQSRRVLVQVGTHARPTGWVEQAATFTSDDGKQTYQGKRVVDTGRMPWAIEDTRVTLTVKNPRLRNARALDPNGEPRGNLTVIASAAAVTLNLPRDALYALLEVE